jgi:hypothetical protein
MGRIHIVIESDESPRPSSELQRALDVLKKATESTGTLEELACLLVLDVDAEHDRAVQAEEKCQRLQKLLDEEALGVREMRSFFGAKDDEMFPAFVRRLYQERQDARRLCFLLDNDVELDDGQLKLRNDIEAEYDPACREQTPGEKTPT